MTAGILVDALSLKRSMVEPRRVAMLDQAFVGQVGPAFPPALNLVGTRLLDGNSLRRIGVFLRVPSVPLKSFLTQPVWLYSSRREKDVGMMVAIVSAGIRQVDGHVGGHPVFLDELAGEL